MTQAFDNLRQQLQLGEEMIAAGADQLFRRWQASAEAIGKLCAGTERWQAAFRQMQAPINLADILRART
jgi:hypothetical protein